MKFLIQFHVDVIRILMIIRLYALSALMMSCLAVHAASNLDFLDGHFNAFMMRLVEPHLRADFETYYYGMMQEVSKAEDKVQQEMYEYLYKLAVHNLKMNYPKWYMAVKPYMNPVKKNDPKLKHMVDKITLFMRRLGAYQEFKRIQLNKHLQKLPQAQAETKKKSSGGALDALKMLASNAGKLFSDWFGPLPDIQQSN